MRAYFNLFFSIYSNFRCFLTEKQIKDHFSLKDVFLIKNCINIKDKTGDTATPIEEVSKMSTINMAKASIFSKE